MARLVLWCAVLPRFALIAIALVGLFVAASPADEVVRIMAANITSGNNQSYDPGHGNRIFQGLDPDIALVQEMNVTLNGSKNSAATYRSWVDTHFGSSFHYHVETGKSIPNGIVSRYPLLATGVWEDDEMPDREFVWARIDLPGDVNLLAVSVHLSSGGGSGTRNAQAADLRALIQANKLATDHVVIGGDFNTDTRSEACLGTLSSVVVTASPWPVDQDGVGGTNASRAKPYDWVAPGSSLAALSTPLVIGANTHVNGLVFDSRDYSPLSAASPVQSGDSGATGMQHMAVMRAFLIPTNEPPVITQGTSVAVTLSKNNTPVAFSRSLNATDVDGDPLTWSISTAAAHGTAGIMAPASGGSVALSYTPATNYTGADSFVVRVSDGQGGTDTITVNLTIEPPPNVVPVITQGASVVVTLSKNNTPTAFSRSLAATDADSDPLAWSISSAASHGTAGIVAPATGGSVALSYVPATNYTGADSFIVQVSDGRGGLDTITVNLTVEEPPNVFPQIAGPTEIPVTISGNNTPVSFNLGLTASDPDSDPLAWSISAPAAHGTAGVMSPASGTAISLSYQPTEDYIGGDSFTVQVADGRGGLDTVTVNVTVVNDEPVISEGQSVAVTLSQNGFPDAFQLALSATDPNGHFLLWSVSSPASHGHAAVVAPGNGNSLSLTYQPEPGHVGTDTFTVQVGDGHGGGDSIIVNVTVEAASALDAWTFSNFGPSPLAPEAEATLWGEDADPDNDGYTNLGEFAHGLDPTVADAAPNLMTISGQGPVVLSYKLRMDGASPALNYVVEATTDPATGWTALLAEEFSLTGEADLGGGFKQRTILLTDPNPPSVRFFRLRFTR